MYKLTLLYWIISLYKPDWMISSYIPALSFLPALNKFILLGVFFSTFFTNKPTREYLYILPFLLLCGLSFLWSENTGIGRPPLILLIQYYLIGVITLTYIDNMDKVKTFFRIFLVHFLYYGLWGAVYFGKVTWHTRLNEEDAFGPYMLLGFIFSFFYIYGEKERNFKLLGIATSIICLSGAIASFTMGTFLTLLILGGYIFVRYPHKIKATVLLITAGFIFVTTVNFVVSNPGEYWQEMSKIYTDTSGSGTGGERLFLWRTGLKIFKKNPILGVGLNNFGIHAPEVATQQEVEDADIQFSGPENLWGFSLHNSHLEVLVELGIVGIILYVQLFYDFWKKNRRVRQKIAENNQLKINLLSLRSLFDNNKNLSLAYSISMGLEGMLVIYIFAGTVYGLLFYPDFWITIIANRMLYKNFENSAAPLTEN